MKLHLLATLCAFLLLSQTSANKNKLQAQSEQPQELVIESQNEVDSTANAIAEPVEVIQEETIKEEIRVIDNSWQIISQSPYDGEDLCISEVDNVNTHELLVKSVIETVKAYGDSAVILKGLLGLGLCVVLAKIMKNNKSGNKENNNNVLFEQVLDLNEKLDRLLKKTTVQDIDHTSSVSDIKEKLASLSQTLSKNEVNLNTLTTTHQRSDDAFLKFKQEVLDTQSIIIKELQSLKKMMASKPPTTQKAPVKRGLTTEVSTVGDLNIDTSATTPLLCTSSSHAPFSASKRPSTFFKVSAVRNNYELKSSSRTGSDNCDDAASPVSISIPLGSAGLALSEILSPAKGLKNPFQASRMASYKQKENVLQMS